MSADDLNDDETFLIAVADVSDVALKTNCQRLIGMSELLLLLTMLLHRHTQPSGGVGIPTPLPSQMSPVSHSLGDTLTLLLESSSSL